MPKYLKIPDKRTFYCDVDDTLIKWNCSEQEKEERGFKLDEHHTVVPHTTNINKLKQFKTLGYIIVVWSQSGSDHAEKVVQMLRIEEFVDLIITKPDYFMDDLPSNLFLPESKRIWKEDIEVTKHIQPCNSW